MSVQDGIPLLPEIVSETDRYFFVAKPSGVVVIPSRAPDERLVLRDWLEEKTGEKAWVVHRIDRETSGLVVFARTADAHRDASRAFESRLVKKEYLFIAEGIPDRPIYRVKSAIHGLDSLTQIEIQRKVEGQSLFWGRAHPWTGRRHQIRIHLKELGFPILGDTKYGSLRSDLAALLGDSAIALHAHAVTLPTGESVRLDPPATWELILKKTEGSP